MMAERSPLTVAGTAAELRSETSHRVPIFASSRTTVARRPLAAPERFAKPLRGLTFAWVRLKTRTLRALRLGPGADDVFLNAGETGPYNGQGKV